MELAQVPKNLRRAWVESLQGVNVLLMCLFMIPPWGFMITD